MCWVVVEDCRTYSNTVVVVSHDSIRRMQVSYAAVFKQCYMHYVFVAYRYFNQIVRNTICKLWLVRSCCFLCCCITVLSQFVLCMSRTVCLLFSISFFSLVDCSGMLERKQSCSCSCCFVLVLWYERKQQKTREEEIRKDRTNGEDVMLLRFDQYKCTRVLSPGCKEVMVHIVRTFYVPTYI